MVSLIKDWMTLTYKKKFVVLMPSLWKCESYCYVKILFHASHFYLDFLIITNLGSCEPVAAATILPKFLKFWAPPHDFALF